MRKILETASSAIDISDGVMSDLQHVARLSGVGFNINYHDLPCDAELIILKENPKFRSLFLSGGDDYELAFTAGPEQTEKIEEVSKRLKIRCTRIGKVTQGNLMRVLDRDGSEIKVNELGYKHF